MKRILIAVVFLLVALAGTAFWWARESLPPLDGELRLPGLNGPVEVLIDSHGVPHVYATGPEDAWFAAGVLHARDRLWQMELYRRAAYGRLSEVLGIETLRIDRRFLTLELRAAAEAEWNVAPPAVRDALTRYAAGVNAQVAQSPGRRQPLEFQILRITPDEWTPIDSLAVGRLLAWRLAENHQAELVRHALAGRFGLNEALRLSGRYPANAPTVVQGSASNNASRPPTDAAGLSDARPTVAVAPTGEAGPTTQSGPTGKAGPTTEGGPTTQSGPTGQAGPTTEGGPTASVASGPMWPSGLEWLHPNARRGGSNNWVIAGNRTTTGRPLLANDPHLQLEFPGVWYELHLVAAGLNVIGVTVPGTPFVILGHNARLAWGMTNTGADVQDLFIERIDVARRRYFYQGQWHPVQVTQEEIPIRGRAPEPFEVWRTRHGTVFADVGLEWEDAPAWLTPNNERSGERRAYALRWDAAGGEMAGAFEALNRAGSWPEFTAAVERFAAPSQNFVYADVDGNIGYAMSGVLPQRSGGVGTMPSDGQSGEGEWSGRVAASALPRLFNPPRGYITSSNNQVDRQWGGFITRDWAAPYRTTTLDQVLRAAPSSDLSTSASWQNDVSSLAAADVLSGVQRAIQAARQRQADAATLNTLEQLQAWDKRMDARPIVTLYHLFEDALWRRTFADEMGEPLFSRFYEWAGAERPAGLYTILDDPSSRWFDDIATIERRESRDDVFALAAADAAEKFRVDYGGEQSWSDVHAAEFSHPIGGGGAPLRWLFNRGPVPVAGDSYSVMRVSYHRLRPFAAWEVPSWRQLFDVGSWDDAQVVLPGGQSGHPLSPHYFDQNQMWRDGQYRRQSFSRSAVDAAHTHRLLFLPPP